MESNNYLILIVLSSIVLISHFFNLIARASRVPSVLLLIGFGIFLKSVSNYFNIEILSVNNYLGFLGTIGLILIVLEGVSDLKIKRHNIPIIRGSFSAALVVLLLSTVSIAALFYFWLKADIRSALVNAIPLGVISSAISIPTVAQFIKHKKEFLTYESIFSDILGIMLFNFMIMPNTLNFSTSANFVFQLLVVFITSIIGAFLLVFILHNMKTQTKFFIILSILVLVYTTGKMFHLSSLLLVFVFGLLLNNFNVISKIKILTRINLKEFDGGVEQFKLIVSESAFLIRTFFFVVFGYSIDIIHIFNFDIFKVGVPIIVILFLVRFIYLKFFIRSHIFPEIFIAPKGLVTILLFYSIPKSMLIDSFSKGEIFFVILVSSLLMIISGLSQKHLKSEIP